MKPIVTLLVASCFLSLMAFGQYGTASRGYYPDEYHGSIFTGVVTETRDNQIILTFIKGSSTETFTGRFETGCSVPTTQQGTLMMPADIPKGTEMTAFFNAQTTKVDGRKVKENSVIAIAFDVWKGSRLC